MTPISQRRNAFCDFLGKTSESLAGMLQSFAPWKSAFKGNDLIVESVSSKNGMAVRTLVGAYHLTCYKSYGTTLSPQWNTGCR